MRMAGGMSLWKKAGVYGSAGVYKTFPGICAATAMRSRGDYVATAQQIHNYFAASSQRLRGAIARKNYFAKITHYAALLSDCISFAQHRLRNIDRTTISKR
jgi:hypothetical protein